MAGLFDDIVRHQVSLERAKGGEVKRIRKLLKKLDNRIFAILSRLPENYTRSELNIALFKIKQITKTFYEGNVISALNNTGRKAVGIEVDFATGIVDKYLSEDKLVSSPGKRDVFNKGIKTKYQGKTLPRWTKDLAIDKVNRINEAARNAAIEGATTSQLTTAVRRQVKIANGNADTITKSYVNQFTNLSRDATYAENNQFVDAIVWSTILDGRTTTTCGARSNKKYDAKTKEPIDHDNLWEGGPGIIHFNCRSVGIPVNKAGVIVAGPAEGQKFDEGEKTAIGADEDYERGDNKTEAGKVAKIPTSRNNLEKEVVPANLTYDSWLRTQPRAFVEDALGVGKAELFLDKKISIEKFVVPDGRELTLTQLEAA